MAERNDNRNQNIDTRGVSWNKRLFPSMDEFYIFRPVCSWSFTFQTLKFPKYCLSKMQNALSLEGSYACYDLRPIITPTVRICPKTDFLQGCSYATCKRIDI